MNADWWLQQAFLISTMIDDVMGCDDDDSPAAIEHLNKLLTFCRKRAGV